MNPDQRTTLLGQLRRACWCSIVCMLPIAATGCSIISSSSNSLDRVGDKLERMLTTEHGTSYDASSGTKEKVSNSPARTIRFDGSEVILGTSDLNSLSGDELASKLQPLVDAKRFHSATALLLQYPTAAHQLVFGRWANSPSDGTIQFIASVLSRHHGSSSGEWQSLLGQAEREPSKSQQYLSIRNQFASTLVNGQPSEQQTERLRQLAQELAHPLVLVDSLKLLGMNELLSQRATWAESLFRQAATHCRQVGDAYLESSMWLLVSAAAKQGGRENVASEAWQQAIDLRAEMLRPGIPLEAAFWLRAEELKLASQKWPTKLASALAHEVARIGCNQQNSAETSLHIAIANALLDSDSAQMALVRYKKAETLASTSDAPWLKIAQGKCLATLGQGSVSAAILSGPAASENESISSAATAALGSAKLLDGAYQQGAQLLNKALTTHADAKWPQKSMAHADLALAQLIVGDSDAGLQALGVAQSMFEAEGDVTSLLQALENELQILQLESRESQAELLQKRIAKLESQ